MTTDTSPEGAQDLALELADALERMSLSTKWDRRAATELRRLHARVQELERGAVQWVSVAERLPEFLESCDWLHRNEIKQECWVLCGESMATASVPGSSTHWRPAQPIPRRARGAQGESND